jgi:hypothetical protein
MRFCRAFLGVMLAAIGRAPAVSRSRVAPPDLPLRGGVPPLAPAHKFHLRTRPRHMEARLRHLR